MHDLNNNMVTGMGIITPVGIGVEQFTIALKDGKTNFSISEFEHGGQFFKFPAAKVDSFSLTELVSGIKLDERIINNAKRLRNISLSASFGVYCALEAWADAELADVDVDSSR